MASAQRSNRRRKIREAIERETLRLSWEFPPDPELIIPNSSKPTSNEKFPLRFAGEASAAESTVAEELTVKGSEFLKENDFAKAVDCFSRALEIRVAQYGELAAECINAYYKYGSALLEKAQAEADPLGNMPRKEAEVQQESSKKDGPVKNAANRESLAASAVSSGQEGPGGKDLDMAWKMLDIARAITEKQSVDILCTLAKISFERGNIESSLSDLKKALSILERLVTPDSRHIAELNYRICFCLETGCQPQEAIPFCQKAALICKARMERLTNEINGSATSSTVSETDEGIQQSSNVNVPYIDKSASDK